MNRVFSCGHIPLMTKPWKLTCHPCSSQCPLGCHPSTVPAEACGQPQPSAKNFCCRITGHAVISRIPCL